jgi:NAD(P)H-hydrate repair Nnr-like enzyme with NAD(P)H-hydrate dehydratase domain
MVSDIAGSPRRCGGQGDLLSGILALFAYWAKRRGDTPHDVLDAMVCASWFIRQLSKSTYKKIGRSMTSTDMLAEMGSFVRDIDKNNVQNKL